MDIKFFDLDGNEITEKLAPCYVVEIDTEGSEVSRKLFNPPVEPEVTKLSLTNVAVTSASARKVGDIWWMPENEVFTLTADVALPDSELMIMSERVINGDTVVDDMRFIANIANGQVTINGTFKTSGNYQITAERLNSGLARIGMPLELIFNKIEFDVYV